MSEASFGDEMHSFDVDDYSSDDSANETECASVLQEISDTIESDRIQNDADEASLSQMLSCLSSEKCAIRKRAMCASLVLVCHAKRQRRLAAVRHMLSLNLAILESYVKFRGGIHAMMQYTIEGHFNLETYGEKETFTSFRFTVPELRRLSSALCIPDVIRTSEGDKCDGIDALCMLCCYYAFPLRRYEMIKKFGTSLSRLSRLIGTLRDMLFNKFYKGMSNPKQLSAERLQTFARAIEDKCGVPHIFGFIDATVRPTAKPEVLQSLVYNGKDRVHALKYQMLCTPDGIMRHVSGPYCGSRHDQHLVHKSEVLSWVLRHPKTDDGHTYCIYADAGYAIAPGLMRPFADAEINIPHKAFNDVMTSVRVCVEWEFGDIVKHWAMLNYREGQKILSGSKPGQQYIVAALLSNCQNCLRPGNTSSYFGITPPTLEEYLNSISDD
jgi:hypothetical protein